MGEEGASASPASPSQIAPALHAPQLPVWQTLFVPQLVPSERNVPASEQTGAPVPQEVVPAWQRVAAVHAAPTVQALHTPPPQTRFVPQLVPFATGTVVSEHTGAPLVQAMLPAWHGLVGVHAAPAWQAMHPPAPTQTWFVPQLVPALWFTF